LIGPEGIMAKPKYPSEKLDQYMLRLPDGMRAPMQAAAEANNRSMNAEIVATLETRYPAPRKAAEITELADLMLDYLPTERGTYAKEFDDAIEDLKRAITKVLLNEPDGRTISPNRLRRPK